MDEDQTLVIQSGKPIGLLKTHAKAPLVIMANCNIVGQWAKAEVFYELEKKGLIVWGGLTAGAWQYIGSQGVIQGTYEIFMRIAEQRFRRRAGRPLHPHRRARRHGRRATARRPHGAAPPSFASMSIPSARSASARRSAISTPSRPISIRRWPMIAAARQEKRADSRSASSATRPKSIPRSSARGIIPDIVTDQTSAHDLVYGYVPEGFSLDEVRALRESDPAGLMDGQPRLDRRRTSTPCWISSGAGAEVFDNGNLIRTQAKEGGVPERLRHPDFHRGLPAAAVCPRHRAVPLDGAVGRPRRHRPHRRSACWRCFRDNQIVTNWIGLARQHVPFEGLPARIAWLGHGERTDAGARGQRAWCARASSRPRSPSPATTSMPAPWRTPTS